MKRWLFALLWLAALLAAGAAGGRHFVPAGGVIRPVYFGLMVGGVVFLALAGLGWLKAVAPAAGTAVAWGWRQALWLVLQFFVMQLAGQIICTLLIALAKYLAVRAGHAPFPAGLGGTVVIATGAGYLAAAAWSVWYIGRLGRDRLKDGSPRGIGWCAAPWQGYAAAIAGLGLVAMVALAVQHIWPPSAAAMQDNPLKQIFGTTGWKVIVLFILAAGLAPFVEELVFRGGVFAALSGPCGVTVAALLTAALFTLAHAEEVAAYLPGGIVIGAVALVLGGLRVRYRSIRPGIMLHILFNGLSIVAAALMK